MNVHRSAVGANWSLRTWSKCLGRLLVV